MNIREAMRLPSLASAEVVTGCDQLDRVVTSAMVLEAIDIETWAKRGQLLITSYFALQGLGERELEAFFEKIDAIGVSGIIFKTERLVRRIPPAMIQLCARHDIPLLAVSKAVRYEELLIDIFGNLLESNLTLLNHFYDVHQQIMELAAAQPTIYQILVSLKHSIKAEVSLVDIRSSTKTSTLNAPSGFTSCELSELEPQCYQSLAHFRAVLGYADGRREAASVIEVPVQEHGRCRLVVHTGSRTLDRIEAMTVENFARLLQIELLKQRALAQQRFVQHNNATLDLLLNRYSSHEEVDRALTYLEMDRFARYQVALVHVRMANSEDDCRRPDVLEAVRRGLRARYPRFAYFMGTDRIVMLNNYDEEEPRRFEKKVISAALDRLHADGALPEFTHTAAVSESAGRYEIGRINKEALDVYQVFGRAAPRNRCVCYSDFGCLRVFLSLENFNELRGSVDPRVLSLYDANPDLFATLVALCENKLHFQDTAKQLYLHPKTVRYRIERIGAAYGIDVHDPNDFLQVLLSGKIMALAEAMGSPA